MRDEWFIRGKVPMTKSEVRAVSLSKLELTPESVLADIGAGTGSVSVEAALSWRVKSVWAIEKNREAVELLRQNIARAERAGAGTIHLLEGEALALLTDPEIREQFQTGHRLTHAFFRKYETDPGSAFKPESADAHCDQRHCPGVGGCGGGCPEGSFH